MTLQPPEVHHLADHGETTSLLDWLRVIADQNVPETFKHAAVPVAWMGRTSTDDAQDPTLSLPPNWRTRATRSRQAS